MTREDGLDPILQPWMERNAPAAPNDLLPRVMREVETVSQRTRTWPSFLAFSPVGTWAGVAGAVILAVAVGWMLLGGQAPFVGGPSATATPTPTPGVPAGAEVHAGTDPLGDAVTGMPDIVGVTTTAVRGEDPILEIEVAEPWQPGMRVLVTIQDGTANPGGSPMYCSPWFHSGYLQLTLTGTSDAPEVQVDGGVQFDVSKSTVEGRALTIWLSPISGQYPRRLYLAVETGGDMFEGDIYPDNPSGNTAQACHSVLTGAAATEGSAAAATATPGTTAEVNTGTDPVGDRPGQPDIVSVTTTAAPGEDVVLQVELAQPWAPEMELGVSIRDGSIGLSSEKADCGPWSLSGNVLVALAGTVDEPVVHVERGEQFDVSRSSVDGRTLTLWLTPTSGEYAAPLYLAVEAAGQAMAGSMLIGDFYPDYDSGGDGTQPCHLVLTGE